MREARRRKGLDPDRSSDLPDEPPDEHGASDQVASGDGDAVGSAPGGDGTTSERDGSVAGSDVGGTGGGDGGAKGTRSTEVPQSRWGLGQVRTGPLESGAAAAAEVLAGMQAPDALDDDALGERTADLLRARSLFDSVLLAHVREWDARCLWATDGSKSPTARLARDANTTRRTASGLVRLARALRRMPHTTQALADGRIGVDHARRLADACTDERRQLFERDERQLIHHAVALAGDLEGFNRIVTHWEHTADDTLTDPTDPDAEPPGKRRQRLSRNIQLTETPDGFDLRGTLTTAGGAIVHSQLQNIYDQLWEADWTEARARRGDAACEADLARTPAQRRADALVEMARRASAHQPGGPTARPLITVLVHATDLFGPIRETFNRTVLGRRDVAEWLTQADFERIVFDPLGQPVNVTSPRRFFTGAMRRAVQVRDRVCAHPTCNVDAERCQIDHITEHSAGGPTHIDNARPLCPRHNRQRPGRSSKKPPTTSASTDSEDDPDQ